MRKIQQPLVSFRNDYQKGAEVWIILNDFPLAATIGGLYLDDNIQVGFETFDCDDQSKRLREYHEIFSDREAAYAASIYQMSCEVQSLRMTTKAMQDVLKTRENRLGEIHRRFTWNSDRHDSY